MIRFLLDFQTTAIIVITDKSIQKVDFYYIADFLEIEKDANAELSIKDLFKELLNYWKLLLSQHLGEAFLLCDLSDQYISGFHFEKFAFKGQEYLKITKKYTQELSGWSVTKNTSLTELKSKTWEIDKDFLMQSNSNRILRGIEWSLENLEINTNPINI